MEKKIINCPSGHGTMEIQKSYKDMKFNDVGITFESEYYVCSVCGLEASSIDQASATQRAISDAYRKKVGLLTSEEIQQGRKRLDLTQDGLTKQMDVGIASIKRWEKGSIQSKSMDKVLRRALGYQEKIHQKQKMNVTDAWEHEPTIPLLGVRRLHRVTHTELLLSAVSAYVTVTATWQGAGSAFSGYTASAQHNYVYEKVGEDSEDDIGFPLDTFTSNPQLQRDAA
jgi:putative zinc finger/helix-turn-helix YgiT family protein